MFGVFSPMIIQIIKYSHLRNWSQEMFPFFLEQRLDYEND